MSTCLRLHHVKLALYVEDTAIIATSSQPALLVRYLETYLSYPERSLREWRIAISDSKSSAMLFVKASRCILKPRPVQLLGEPIQWVDTACYLGVTLDTPLIWSTYIDQAKKEIGTETGSAGTSPKQMKWSVHQEWSSAAQAAHPSYDGLHVPCLEVRRLLPYSKLQMLHSKCLRIATNAPWYIGNKQIHDDLGVLSFTDHIRFLRDSTQS